MQRIVSAYLDMAEMQAMRKIPMTMADWEGRLGGFLKLWDRDILQDAGKVSAELAKTHAEIDLAAARIHAELWGDLSERGQMIGPHDLWLAASALANDCTLVTRNIREFNRVSGLKVEIW